MRNKNGRMKIKQIIRRLLADNQKIKFRQIFYRIRGLWYKGGNYYCPCCSTHVRKFLAGGVSIRPHAQCPRCGSLERHRLLWLFLQRKTDFFQQSLRVLDIAPSFFLQQQFQHRTNLDYISADLTAPWVMTHIDLTDIHFPDNHFDRIICYHVLEHIPDDRRAIGELFRVLKPGGWAILQSPVDMARATTFENPQVLPPEERLCLFGQEDHVRIYGQDYTLRLREAGFQVTADDFVQCLAEEEVHRYGLMREEVLFVCHKPDYRIAGTVRN